jgi:hypothetical protein
LIDGVDRTRESAVNGRTEPMVEGGMSDGPAVKLFTSAASRVDVPNLHHHQRNNDADKYYSKRACGSAAHGKWRS